ETRARYSFRQTSLPFVLPLPRERVEGRRGSACPKAACRCRDGAFGSGVRQHPQAIRARRARAHGISCSGGVTPSPSVTTGGDCPASAPSGACSNTSLRCEYGATLCGCTSSQTGPSWTCITPDAGCPSVRPRLGSTCAPANQFCDYGSCVGLGAV